MDMRSKGILGSGWLGAATTWLLMLARYSEAYNLDTTSIDSIRSTARYMAADLMSFYDGDQPGQVPGLLPQPYYWWEAGAMMGSLIDYWYYTGDSTYVNVTQEGLLFQAGPNSDYMTPNQTLTEGNDDQGFWGMAVMSAAEYKFPDPPADKAQWLALAQAVFNTQAARWDESECGGGLRWQIFQWNRGFDYKNTISQACFFNLAARLAIYTGNQSYADWADKAWDWMAQAKLMVQVKLVVEGEPMDPRSYYYIYDGIHTTDCSVITPYQWTYNAGALLLGAAAMYSFTNGTDQQDGWRESVDGLLNGIEVFFTGDNKDIMTEAACEPVNLCNVDQQSFKAYLSRWMAATTKWAPHTYDHIMALLRPSARAASAQCKGGANGRMCGLRWTDHGNWDGTTGVGQQMAALEVVLATLIQTVELPVTSTTGGTSPGNPAAAGSDMGLTDPAALLDNMRPISAADRAGAAMATFAVLTALVAAVMFVLVDETTDKTAAQQLAELRAAVLPRQGCPEASSKGKDWDFYAPGSVMNSHQNMLEKDLATSSSGGSSLIGQASLGSFATGSIPSPVPRTRPSQATLSRHQKHRSTLPERATQYWGDDALAAVMKGGEAQTQRHTWSHHMVDRVGPANGQDVTLQRKRPTTMAALPTANLTAGRRRAEDQERAT